MASIPVTIIGVMTLSDVGVGGGPMPGGPTPTPPIYYPPPVYPAHPIAPGGPEPTHPIVIPPDAIAPGVPTHPIVIPQPPLGIWGGGNVPMPTPPIYYPPAGGGVPTHPIVIPPGSLAPGIPSHPIYWPIEPAHPIAPGGPPPQPAHPIVIPGDDENKPKFEIKAAWTPQTGWITVIVPGEGATVPTPGA